MARISGAASDRQVNRAVPEQTGDQKSETLEASPVDIEEGIELIE
jgi:hypothetical protein